MTEWIPIKRRKPKENTNVLVNTVTGEIFIGQFSDGFWFDNIGDLWTNSYILAWMPLPERYKDDTDSETQIL